MGALLERWAAARPWECRRVEGEGGPRYLVGRGVGAWAFAPEPDAAGLALLQGAVQAAILAAGYGFELMGERDEAGGALYFVGLDRGTTVYVDSSQEAATPAEALLGAYLAQVGAQRPGAAPASA